MSETVIRNARRISGVSVLWASVGLCAALAVAGCTETKSTPTSATPPPASPTPAAPTITGLTVTGTSAFTARGAVAQFAATATLSDGSTRDETRNATWTTDNAAVAIVSAQGLVTAQNDGDTNIAASVSSFRSARAVNVKTATPTPGPVASGGRTPDPPAGQRIPMPDIQAFLQQRAATAPDMNTQSCPTGFKYVNNPWLDYMVDGLRTLDTRWGYNGKPNRGPADNGGMPVVAAGDEIAYHYGPGPDQGSPDVYLIDILAGHCGTPSLTYRVFTGEEPAFWTGAGRLR